MITLISKDGDNFSVEREVVEEWNTLKNALETVGEEGEFPVDVETGVLKKIVHLTERKRENGELVLEDVDVDQDTIFKLIIKANYLDFPALLDICSTKIANMLKGKTPQQIRETFGIEADEADEETTEPMEI